MPNDSNVEYLSTIIDESQVKKARKEAEAYAGSMATEDWKYLRKRAKIDLYFLSYGILGYTRLSPRLHGHMAYWMMRNWNARFKCILMPRGHFKSTILTVSHSIQIVLPDETGIVPWPESLGPNCRVMLGHEIKDSASKFLLSITEHFMRNTALMGLFPECIPERNKHRINLSELELPRTQMGMKEATFTAVGVGGRLQGSHFNYLKLDDLVGDKARDSRTEMESAKQWFDGVTSYFDLFKQDKLDLIGTRWGHDDIYAHAFEQYGPSMRRYIRSVEELDTESDTIKTIFPEEFTPDILNILRKNKKNFASNYLNNPDDIDNGFQLSWLQYYERRNENTLVITYGADDKELVKVSDLDICILVDPAMTGQSGTIVTGTDFKDRVFILEALETDIPPEQYINKLFELVYRYNPRVVSIEAVLFSGLYQNWLPAEMQLRGKFFEIQPYTVKGMAKEARIYQLSHYFSAGDVFIEADMTDFIYEYRTFGASDANKHLLDALAQGPEVWVRKYRPRDWNKMADTIKSMVSKRDPITGYSVYRSA